MAEARLPFLNAVQPIVFEDGTMAQHFRDYMNIVNRAVPVTGEGSPEGVIEALQFTFYIDSLGLTGTILWIKMQPSIGGDSSLGWLLV